MRIKKSVHNHLLKLYYNYLSEQNLKQKSNCVGWFINSYNIIQNSAKSNRADI